MGSIVQRNQLQRLMQVRNSSFKEKVKRVEKDPRRYIVGAGSAPDPRKIGAAASVRDGLGSILDLMTQSIGAPVWNMDIVEQVRWTMAGPQSDASVTQNFGAEIDLFGSGKAPPGIDYVETTMAQTGQTQTHFVACYIGFHMEPEPMCWTARGNAATHPVTGQAKPPSPDVFTINDRLNGALGAIFAGPTEAIPAEPTGVYVPSVLEWGWWANYACWHMARGYNLRWRIGQHTNILDEVLRHTAYMPPSAQEGSASNSQVDICRFVQRANRRYDDMGSPLDFMKVDFLRIGSDAAAGVNVGRFTPTRDFELVDATYGGMDLRSMLKGNSEMRKLCVPYVIKPGVPIGLILQENDSVQADTMREYLSISQGQGGSFPPAITDDENWLASDPTLGGASPVMLERTLAGTDVAQQVDSERYIFKGGDLKLTLPIRGFEVDEDWYNELSKNADVRAAVFDCVGIRFAQQ